MYIDFNYFNYFNFNFKSRFNVQGDLYLACEIFISEKAYNFSLDPYLEKSLGQS